MTLPFLVVSRLCGWIDVEWRLLLAPFYVAGIFAGMALFVAIVLVAFMLILHLFGIIPL